MPLPGQFANFISWVVYALLKGDRAILQVNVIGVAFSLVYGTIFLTYARGHNWYVLAGSITAAVIGLGAIFAGVVMPSALSNDQKINALGIVAVIANTIMYASPLAGIRIALRSMDPHAIPLLLTAASTGCSACWLFYGFLTDNPFVWGPNVAGVALSVLQIVLAIYITLRVRSDPTLTKHLDDADHHEHHELTGGHDDDAHHVADGTVDTRSVGATAAVAVLAPLAVREPTRRARGDKSGAQTPYTPLATADSLAH